MPRPNARCPECYSLERHRLIWLYFQTHTDLFDGQQKRFLHIAPEVQIAAQLRKLDHLDYLSADLDSPDAMVHFDITDIPYEDNSFDVIYCSHVLEHVPDDRRAMAELRRVLKPDGWAVLQVPIKGETTLEDPSVTSPEERARLYGRHNHVRQYGIDYRDRLSRAGFRVNATPLAQELGERATRYFGLERHEVVHDCRK